MQLLLIHADFMEYEAKERTKVAEDIEDERKRRRVEEVLAVLVAVESGDDDAVVEQAAQETLGVARTVHAKNILIYPYAHLSSNLAAPELSVNLLKALEERLKNYEFEVHRAPFGWYKAFTLRCKGHPLSELSRRIRGRHESAALRAEERGESRFYIMDCDGTLHEPQSFDFLGLENLRKFYEYEAARSRVVDRMPPHVELMRRLEIADYEPSSDPGNLRFYPKGTLIKELIKSYVSQALEECGAMRVETPLMYSMDHPTLRSYLDRFPARQYSVSKLPEENHSLFLRFAACFGQFMMGKDMEISYRHLPLRMFEIASSFRLEKRGELVGLRRLRNFTMPDMHTLCKDMEQAVEEFRSQFRLCMNVLRGIGFNTSDYEVAIRFTKDFYDAHKDLIESLVSMVNKPVLVEIWERRFFYFVLKFEFNFVDALSKASALSTVQIDVENAKRYNITYVDANGEKKFPIILHCSPSGALERCVYALLEKAYMKMENEGRLPTLPLWLSPTQLRIIPVADRHVGFAENILKGFEGVRTDLDDRDETVSRKIRDAGREWVPYVAVVGDKEIENNILTVTVREESSMKEQKRIGITAEELKERMKRETEGFPFRVLPLPQRLSKRPKFVGAS